MDAYGLSRVVNEPGVLPQRAKQLDPALPLRSGEMLIAVDSLNIDAASFHQIKGEAGNDPKKVSEIIQGIVRQRGKMQNPITGSGGMLIGRVKELAPDHPRSPMVKVGDRIATLVSLTLTPLHLDGIQKVDLSADRVDVKGRAILFASGLYALLPGDLPDALSLAVLDVCGAPGQVARLAKPGMKIAVLGSGKSGALCMAEARRRLNGSGRVIALDVSPQALETLRAMDLCDETVAVDATQAVKVMQAVEQATGGALCDLVINCASVPNTEMATILSTRSGGTALFFSMATSFTTATLGAEGVGKDVTLLMGNGYVPGHAELALDLIRSHARLRAHFEARYVR